MLKLAYRYDQSAARLMLEGLPDISANHGQEVIGILSSWTLQFVGSPPLEGKREHLEAMLATVLPYARFQISGLGRHCGTADSPVTLSPASTGGHQLELRSSQPGVEPLTINLDDAELADLVRCLDAMRLDPRVQINWPHPQDRPLARRELAERIPLMKRLAAPVLGGVALVVVAGLASVLPLPELNPKKPVLDPTPPTQSTTSEEGSSDATAPQ
ncbi:MAG: DUF4335 domain-containing protein [Synechococcus sp.]|nr:DUF4335 domain-containing protein [Synechococcus sp.]